MPQAPGTHPGAVLRTDFLEARNISLTDLAVSIGVPDTQIGGILAGRRSISGDIAMRLATYFGTTPEFWTNLQGSYDQALVSAASEKWASRKPKLPARRR
jgi:addiction module HigA family antidote